MGQNKGLNRIKRRKSTKKKNPLERTSRKSRKPKKPKKSRKRQNYRKPTRKYRKSTRKYKYQKGGLIKINPKNIIHLENVEEHVGAKVELVLRDPDAGDPLALTLPNNINGETDSVFRLLNRVGRLRPIDQGNVGVYGPCVTIYFPTINREVVVEVPASFDDINMPGQPPFNAGAFVTTDHYYVVIRKNKTRTIHKVDRGDLRKEVLGWDNRRQIRDALKGRFNKLPTGEIESGMCLTNPWPAPKVVRHDDDRTLSSRDRLAHPAEVLDNIAEQTKYIKPPRMLKPCVDRRFPDPCVSWSVDPVTGLWDHAE